jgi:hypothetical protein
VHKKQNRIIKRGKESKQVQIYGAKPMSFLLELNVTVKSAHQKLNVTEIGRLSRPPKKKPKGRKLEQARRSEGAGGQQCQCVMNKSWAQAFLKRRITQ